MSNIRLSIVLPVAFVLVTGILINAVIYIEVRRGERIELVSDFENRAINHILKLSNSINTYLLSLHSLTTWLESEKNSGVFEQKEIFKKKFDFITNDFISKLPAVLFYALATRHDQLKGGFPVRLLKHKNGIDSFLGTDISIDPRTRAAFSKATGSGQMYASAKTSMGEGQKGASAVFILSPLYESLDEEEDSMGKKILFGFGLVSIDFIDFISRALGEDTMRGIDFYLYDLADPSLPSEKRLLYASSGSGHPIFPRNDATYDIIQEAYIVRNIFFANRPISIVMHPAPKSMGQFEIKDSSLFFISGLLITFVLAGYLNNSLKYSRDIEKTVRLRTTELSNTNKSLGKEIDNRKTAEERVRQRDSQLAHSQRLALIGEMGAAMAHELNQPLTGIMNYAENAKEYLNRGQDGLEPAKDNLTKIIGQVRRAKNVITHLRTFSIKDDLHSAEVDITNVLENVMELLSPQIKRGGVEILKKYGNSIPLIIANELRLEQVFLNIILNSIDAVAKADVKQVEVISRLDGGNNIVVEISDTGVGLKEGEEEEIFHAFYSTKDSTKGTGLGLTICKRIITELGGSISARNNEKCGAIFSIRLPVAGDI